jgi:hypothetical protein
MRSYLSAALILMSSRAQALDIAPDWEAVRGVDSCAFIQQEPVSKNRLEISSYPSTDEIVVSVADPVLKVSGFKPLTAVAIVLEPGKSRVGDGYLQRDTDERPATISVTVNDPTFLVEFAQATAMTISYKSVNVRRTIRSPAQAIRALANCEDAKLRAWGIDPSYLRDIRTRPTPVRPLNRLFSVGDWPPGYLLNGVTGHVAVRLTVGTNGGVQDCIPLNRGVDRYFLQTVCEKLRKYARFQAAVDQEGVNVAAPYITGVSFGLER